MKVDMLANGDYPVWRHGDHVLDARGCAAVVEGRKGDQVLVLWGIHDNRAHRGWVHARSLTAITVAGRP